MQLKQLFKQHKSINVSTKRVTNTENTTVIMKGLKWFLHAQNFGTKNCHDIGKANKSQFEI